MDWFWTIMREILLGLAICVVAALFVVGIPILWLLCYEKYWEKQ